MATLDRRTGYQQTLKVDPAGGTAYTTIVGVIDGISGPSASRDEVDGSSIDDAYEVPLPEMIRTGEVSFDVIYDPNNSVNQALTDLLEQTSPTPQWRVEFQTLSDESAPAYQIFSGWLKSMSLEAKRGSLVKRTITIRVSGDVGFRGVSGS